MATVKLTEKPAAPGVEQAVVIYGGKVYLADAETLKTALSVLPLEGGTLKGPLILAEDPVKDLGAATKQYVDKVGTDLSKRIEDTVTGNIQIMDLGAGDFDITALDFSQYAAGDVVLVVGDMDGGASA